jgi:hypothetical protein
LGAVNIVLRWAGRRECDRLLAHWTVPLGRALERYAKLEVWRQKPVRTMTREEQSVVVRLGKGLKLLAEVCSNSNDYDSLN